MKAYIISEAEMRLLNEQMESAFRARAERHGEKWNLQGPADQPPTLYDSFKTANFVLCRWQQTIGGVALP